MGEREGERERERETERETERERKREREGGGREMLLRMMRIKSDGPTCH